jgi:putative ATP-dependent endonuclease of OLD family
MAQRRNGRFLHRCQSGGRRCCGHQGRATVTFIGAYDPDEDDFTGNTFYSRSLTEGDKPEPFSKKDKQHCGFLFLRSLRTGSRALSLEHGSLLDIILRLKEIRPQMWEGTIGTLAGFDVASDPALGISGVLTASTSR